MNTEFKKALDAFTEKLKIPSNYFVRIVNEDDDWTAIIKFHFLLEGALKLTLVNFFKDFKINDELYKLDFDRVVNILVKMKFLDAEEKKFIGYIQNKRNKLIHNVGHGTFSFEEDFKNKDLRKNFQDMTEDFFPPDYKIQGKIVNIKNFILENPKFALLQTIMSMFVMLEYEIRIKEIQKSRKTLSDAKLLIGKM